MNTYCVYKHTAPNGKIYIGITRQNPLARWCNGFGYKNNAHFWNAIVKYGWDNFSHEILFDGLTKAEACEHEKRLIAESRSNDPAQGYNISSGGEHAGAGVPKSEETRENISRALRGRKLSSEHVKRSTAAHIGIKRSDETRQRMSASAKQRGMSEQTAAKRRVQVICIETKIIYPSMAAAAAETGILRTAIGNCCTGKAKTAGGYVWRYYNKK